jgi:class 3 adenylate cyclase/tetratricopeptide (TPR) repeat protein
VEGSERREATVLFCDLGGYTRWNEEEDPEDVAFVMDLIRSEATRIFEAHGGIVNQFVGDEVMGLFGVVSSHEDDPSRALAAALAFHAFLRGGQGWGERRTWPLRLHSGAETGLIYARVHDLRSGLFEVTGEAVNTAARLRAMASPDELICGPALQRQVEHFYRLEPLAPVRLYRTAEPIIAHRVVEPTTSNTWFEVAALRGLTHYVNREVELQTLLQLWRRCEQDCGAVVAIAGPPGIGKTRFLHEFRTRLGASASVLHGRCSAYRNVAPYQPFIEGLTGLLETLTLASPTLATPDTPTRLAQLSERYRLSVEAHRSLAYLLTPSSESSSAAESPDAAELRAAIVRALDELIAHMTLERPVLVILEDWHWADEASRNALRQIGQGVETRRLLIAINYRSTELTEQAQPAAAVRIELCALDSLHTESMARRVFGGGQLPVGLSAFVHHRTLGNPFFVEEFCRALLDTGTCRVQSDSVVLLEPLLQLRAPSTVQAIVRARLDRLPPEQRALLRLASVIGPQFTLELLEVLSSDSPPEATELATDPVEQLEPASPVRLLGMLHELESQDMVHRDDTQPTSYRFKHAITREVVYESLPVRSRKHHHARLAHEMERRTTERGEELEPHFEALAHHYRLSTAREQAIKFAILAGDKAWRTFALEQAGLQYRHAIEALAELATTGELARARHVDVSLSWARVGIYNPHPAQVDALRVSLGFARDLGDRQRAALCLNWLCWIEYGLGNLRRAVQYADQFLEEAQGLQEVRLLAQAHINRGRCHMLACEYTQAATALEHGMQLRARPDGAGHSFALSNLAMVYGDRGDFAQALAHLEESERIASGRLSLVGPLLVLRAILESWQGHWEAAIATCARAHEVALRIEGQFILGMSLLIGGYARYMSSFDPAALVQTRAGLHQLENQGIRLHMSYNWSLLASALAYGGEYDEAEAAAQQALSRAVEFDRQGESESLRVLALVAALRDRQLPRAEDYMARALREANEKHSERDLALCDLTASRIARAQGEFGRGAGLLDKARARAARIGLTLPRERTRQTENCDVIQ